MCHQSKWQRHILETYGNEVVLLDATYNTTVYGMPLYLLCCLTNCGYMVVGCFLSTDDQASTIKAGLQQILDWNPDWKPKVIMSDFSEAQISAAEDIFPCM